MDYVNRNEAFDAAKGVLIILVIIGHVLLGSLSENLSREIIYFFHMPLFLGISGFFTKRKLIESSFSQIIKKLKNRLILPFLIAFIFFTVLFLLSQNELNLRGLFRQIIYPYYHLWYIPCLLYTSPSPRDS